MLAPEIFRLLTDLWGPCQVDLFVSMWNAQLPRYFSWKPDPGEEAVDAFLQDWSVGQAYAFPPFLFIQLVAAQVRRQKASLILITPIWRAQVWFPSLLELSWDSPIHLPYFDGILSDPLGLPHPLVLQGHLPLMAWRISGDLVRRLAFTRC